MTCTHLGPCRGIKVRVREETFDGSVWRRESLRVCHAPAVQRDSGKPVSCLPTFAGELPANMRGVVLQCARCQHREEAAP